MTDLIAPVMISLILFMVTAPQKATCRYGYVEGVRPDGRSMCVVDLVPESDSSDCKTGSCDGKSGVQVRYPIKLDCMTWDRPVVWDHKTIRCQRR